MKIIVGLGNFGSKYEFTRHNLGFMTLERFLKDFVPLKKTNWQEYKQFKSDIVDFLWHPSTQEEEKILLVKPKTYMNNSGLAISILRQFYKVNASDIWVVHDEIDLPLGNMKIRLGGSSAGHKGITSIIEQLGTDGFWRFRLGIGQTQRFSKNINFEDVKEKPLGKKKLRNVEEFVISPFDHSEAGKVRELIKRASKSLKTALDEGL